MIKGDVIVPLFIGEIMEEDLEYKEFQERLGHMTENIEKRATANMKDIAEVLMEQMSLTEEEARVLVSFYFEELANAIIHNAYVSIPPVGKWVQEYTPSGVARNPHTREKVYTHRKRHLKFTTSARLHARMNYPDTYREKYVNADRHTLLLEDEEYDINDPTFSSFNEGIAKGYTEDEVIAEMLRQAKEEPYYFTKPFDNSEE